MTAGLSAPGGWRLQADVPDGIFTLAVDADDDTARAEHQAVAARCLPFLLGHPGEGTVPDPEQLAGDLVSQLGQLRAACRASGLSYLGAVAGADGDRISLILISLAATPIKFPDHVDPASVLAAMLRHEYPGAAVEEFETATGVAAGVRRCESQESLFGAAGLNAGADGLNAGVAQALVPFPDAGLLGAVTCYSYSADDVDTAAVFAGTIACRMRAVPPAGAAPAA